MLWCNKPAQDVFLTGVYKPLKKIAWRGSWGWVSQTWQHTMPAPHLGESWQKNHTNTDTCLKIQLSLSPHLAQFHISAADLFRKPISAFDLWTLGGERSLAEARFYRNSEHYHCLSARHTALCARPFACGCGRGVWLAMFRYCKYLSHSHSCSWDLVSALSVAMVKAPVRQKKLLAEILWTDSWALDIFWLFAVEWYWRNCCFSSSGSSSVFNCPFFFFQFNLITFSLRLCGFFFFLHSHMWWF